MNSRRFVIRLALAILVIGVTPCALPDEIKCHVLIADYVGNDLQYRVDGRIPGENQGLLIALSNARAADPDSDAEIVLLVHERATLSDVYNLIGMIIKADYTNYRVFVFGSDKKSMTELTYSEPVRFSADGNISGE